LREMMCLTPRLAARRRPAGAVEGAGSPPGRQWKAVPAPHNIVPRWPQHPSGQRKTEQVGCRADIGGRWHTEDITHCLGALLCRSRFISQRSLLGSRYSRRRGQARRQRCQQRVGWLAVACLPVSSPASLADTCTHRSLATGGEANGTSTGCDHLDFYVRFCWSPEHGAVLPLLDPSAGNIASATTQRPNHPNHNHSNLPNHPNHNHSEMPSM